MSPGCPFQNPSYISSNLLPILCNLSSILLSVCALVCPSTRLSCCLAHLIGGRVVVFLTGLLFHKINKWYLRSRVESITNGTWRKGNLGRSAQAATATEWVFTVKYNQCITKHITRGLLKKPSTPHSPPCCHPTQWKCPTLSLPTWFAAESQSEKVRADTFFAEAEAKENLRKDRARGDRFTIYLQMSGQILFLNHRMRLWRHIFSFRYPQCF